MASFIYTRHHIQDNSIIANEIFHFMKQFCVWVVEACTKAGSKEEVRSKGVDEGVESEWEGKIEGMGLAESEE